MTTLLLTNDDGYRSEGIKSIFNELQKIGEVFLIAPECDQSAVSHALTMNKPLRVTNVSESITYINGTPADCVTIAVEKLLAKRPDILISGINHGANLGDDISYSGTVSAATEGTMFGIPSIAFSLTEKSGDFNRASRIAGKITRLVLQKGLPENTLLNVNIPATGEIKGIRITRQGRKRWLNGVQISRDPWGTPLYWHGGGTVHSDPATDTDVYISNDNYVSITPIHLDKTNHEGIFQIKEDWNTDMLTEDIEAFPTNTEG